MSFEMKRLEIVSNKRLGIVLKMIQGSQKTVVTKRSKK